MTRIYDFRTLNYLGSKLRLLDFIERNVLKVTPSDAWVCDLFAGSGCVSYRLSQKFPVIACDIQHYSNVICNALLQRFDIGSSDVEDFFKAMDTDSSRLLMESFSPLIDVEEAAINEKDVELLASVLEYGSVQVFDFEGCVSLISPKQKEVSDRLKANGLYNEKSLISRYYGGVYFSYRQAVLMDMLLETIHHHIRKENRDVFLAALLSTASDIVDTVGKHFAQPIKARDAHGRIKSIVYSKAVKDKKVDVLSMYKDWIIRYINAPKTSNGSKFILGDYGDCLLSMPNEVKTIYADPPYTREHYSRFYHVLETITLRDDPDISTVTIHGTTHVSNGIYRKGRHQSPFCIRSKAPEAFMKMFEIASAQKKSYTVIFAV